MLGKLSSSKGFLIDGYPREVAQVGNFFPYYVRDVTFEKSSLGSRI